MSGVRSESSESSEGFATPLVPDVLYIGVVEGHWAIFAFKTHSSAARWLLSAETTDGTTNHRIFRVMIGLATELVLSPPAERTLVPVSGAHFASGYAECAECARIAEGDKPE
jgi:hypothetical protein